MRVAKDGIRSIVKIGYDGRVHKTFRGTNKEERFANEVLVLQVLEARGCDFVPKLLDSDEDTVTIITTNCGAPVDSLSDEKTTALFKSLEDDFGVIHDDPFSRNITYNGKMGRFCIIDFELATVVENAEDASLNKSATRTLEWCGLTRAGKRKKGNQDALSVFSAEVGTGKKQDLSGEQSIDESGLIFAVSDGMGGPGGGEVASKLVVQELHRFLPAMMGDFKGQTEPMALLESAVTSLHDYVGRIASRTERLKHMGATVVCGLFFRTEVHFAHVGDSRLYRFRDGELKQLTYDHSYVGRMFHAGKLNEREARMHPQRNILLQAIGGQSYHVNPQVDQSSVLSGDWFFICSDGVIDGLWDKNIAEAFRNGTEKDSSAQEVGERILNWAYSEAGKDDTTLFVVKVK